MARRLRIPCLVDLVTISGAGELLATVDHPALDRDFAGAAARGRGPWVNRMLIRRLARGLRTPDEPLPSARGRDDEARRRAQQELAARFAPERAPWDEGSLDALAAYVRGDRGRPLGELAQEAVGRLFDAGYCADASTWRAARRLDAWLRVNHPVRRVGLALRGGAGAAQRRLAAAVGGDAAAVHATGVAVHTFAEGIEHLASVLGDRRLRARISTRGALARSMTAPESVIRVVTVDAYLGGTYLPAGTLVRFQLARATSVSLDPRVAFLSESWAFCPARTLVPALLAEIWARATGERLTGPAPSGAASGATTSTSAETAVMGEIE